MTWLFALDSTGVKVSNRGGVDEREVEGKAWLDQGACERRRGNKADTRGGDHERGGGGFEKSILVEQSMSVGKVSKVLADGAYDKRDNFNYSKTRGITMGIKTRANASTKARGSPYRAKMVRERKTLGYDGWRDKYEYGKRWIVEGVYSTFKRIFGETLRATSIPGMIRELQIKIMAYNVLINIA